MSVALMQRGPPVCALFAPSGSHGHAPKALTLRGGGRRWRVYAPRDSSELMRRDSSPDYSQEDLGEPVLEVILQPGVRPKP